MEGSFLRFYLRENQRHRGKLLWEWLLEQANRMGFRGGSAFGRWPVSAITITCMKIISLSWPGRSRWKSSSSSPTLRRDACSICCGKRRSGRSTPIFRPAAV